MKKPLSEYTKSKRVKGHFTKSVKQKVEENAIVYTEPENEFVDGHPMGNGDLGIMVTGSPSSFKFYYSKSDIWDNRTVNNGESVYPEVNYDELIKIVETGDRDRFQELNKQAMINYGSTHYPSPQSCGLLDISFAANQYKSYNQILSLYSAEEKINWQTKNGNYSIDCFISQDQNISEVNVDYFDSDENRIEISLYRPPTDLYKEEIFFSENGYTGFEFTYPDGLKYVNLMHIDSERDFNIEDYKIQVSKGVSSNVRIIQTITTSFETDNPKKLAIERIDAYLQQSKNVLVNNNKDFWEDFWNRSYIDLFSKDVEKIWYMGIYLIGSSSRPGTPSMPGLQGVWLDNYSPAWKGSYTVDLNIEMNYWPVYTSNHLDLAEPFYRCYKDMIPKFQKDTSEFFGKKGVRVPICHDNKGNDGAGYLAGLFWQGSSAWIASLYWKNYLYSNDKDFLKETAYPFMLEAVKYYNDILRKKDGKYLIYLSWTPEEMESDQIKAIDNNPTIDVSLIGNFYNAFVKTVEILDIEPEVDMNLVNDIQKNFPVYSRKDGHLSDSENCNFDYCHRHLSIATPIYPSGEFNSYNNSGENYQLGLNTFYKHIKRDNANKRMYFSGTVSWLACVAAALGLKDFANIYLSDYLDSYANRKNFLNMTFDYRRSGRGMNLDDTQTFSAGTEYQFPERLIQIETNTCAAEAVNLMLLQSFNAEITLFPAYPWRNGTFEGLRAEGGFLVSAKQTDWNLESAFIESLYGNRCTIYLDSKVKSKVKSVVIENTEDGKTIDSSELKTNDIGNKVYFSFNTEKDSEYRISVKY